RISDYLYVKSGVEHLIPTLKKGALVIVESTKPVGTTKKVQEIIFEERLDLNEEIFIAYCPERVLPGNVIYELEQNDRAIGGIDEASTEKDRKSTRLNSSHVKISYAVFCLKKKKMT